jgi:putative ABC transport system permease protein
MTFRQFAYRNVARNKRTYAAYFLSSSFSVMIFFVCALFVFNPVIQEGLLFSVVTQAMLAAEAIMYVFSFFFVLYSVSSFMQTRKREFGILLMHGMTKGQLNRMIFLENMIIGAGAILTGIITGLLTGKLFLMICSSFLGIPSLPFFLSGIALGLTVGSFALLFLIISICTTMLVKSDQLIELFQSGQKPKTEPKASASIAILAAVLLLTSYTLAATATVGSVYIRMLPVILMTILGTYFFYTQLSIYLIRLLQRNRSFYWKKTNMVILSSLAYRIKDNARMFTMVTVISSVSFCSVGVFTSIHTLSKQFHEDYPAAIVYVAKGGSTVAQMQLNDIQSELAAKGIAYKQHTMTVKYTDMVTAEWSDKALSIPVLSFSDYKQHVEQAGLPFQEQELAGNETLVMLTSQRELAFLHAREPATFGLKDSLLTLREIGYTQHVPIPDYLINDIEEGFSGLVVSDTFFQQIGSSAPVDTYTGFYVDDFEQTFGIAEQLAEGGVMRYGTNNHYAITVSGTLAVMQKSLYSTMLLAALLVGMVFFIAAGSFLYFRLYADLDYDRRQTASMAKLGLTEQELRTIVTRQLLLLFFVPIGLASVHSIFAFIALQSFFYLSIAGELAIVLIGFIVAQVLYFFFIRNRYLRNLQKLSL